MVLQTDLRPAFVAPIPPTRVQARRLMLAVGMLVDGFLDDRPDRFQRYLENCFLMPGAGLILGGTLCRRPLIVREFADVCGVSGLDGILARLNGEAENAVASFDIHSGQQGVMHCAYRLWMPQPTGQPWLVPTGGERTFVRFDPFGLDFSGQAPFDCEIERVRGLRHGREFLSVAMTGWF